jgi:hypothetical protein
MSNIRFFLTVMLLSVALFLSACGGDSADATPEPPASDGAGLGAPVAADTNAGDIDAWLQQVRTGELPAANLDDSFAWGLGYLVYYGPVETLVVDNLIYNALRAHHRAGAGDTTAVSRNDQNLIDLTDGIVFDPAVDPTEQLAQTPEIRQAIVNRIVTSQRDLTPDEALASNEVVGVIAPPAPEALGGKYLVYTQETPDSEFNFLGVVIVVDATTSTREPYSHQGWQSLPWLGDAAGPFWNDLPAGVSGDKSNTGEGRPGVLLISEDTYDTIRRGS